MKTTGMWVGALTCLVAAAAWAPADAQRGNPGASERRVYCWEDNGQKICGDVLPASAVDAARIEFSSRTGVVREQVRRAPSAEERAAASQAAHEAAEDAEAETDRRRRDLAMVESYATETDLERAYGDRITLIDESIKTSRMGVANLRASLVALLRQAADLELQQQPVHKQLADDIHAQHGDLLRQQAILEQQLAERGHLDGDLQDALGRYRGLKHTD